MYPSSCLCSFSVQIYSVISCRKMYCTLINSVVLRTHMGIHFASMSPSAQSMTIRSSISFT